MQLTVIVKNVLKKNKKAKECKKLKLGCKKQLGNFGNKNCHPEDNSPKYRMVGKIVSVSCGLNPSPAFQAHSAQGRQGHTHRTALRFPLSPQVAREKIRSIGNMKENIFSNKVYSLFTTHHSFIHNDMDFSRFTFHFSLKAAFGK